jgi:histidinol-phosphate/aromatic aminotransferase/cobyric acid decarboxylase-like protein/N-acyl-L-homoserine lactone synthetase
LPDGAEADWDDLPAANGGARRLTVRLAAEQDRAVIYRLRHEVYARELGQHPVNAAGRLMDSLDAFNTYLVICAGSQLVGFVSITPPGSPSYSIDKYFKRDQLPFPVDDRLYEVRLLTVPQSARRTLLALALMYAAFRWVEAHGGTRIMAIGRRELMGMYARVGLKAHALTVKSGAVTYELMQGTMADVHEALPGIWRLLERIEATMAWQFGVAYWTPAPCYHGGTFFTAVGEEFDTLERLAAVISADVLDAWFRPSPKAVAALQQYLPRLLRTSPPTGCEGLVRTIARVRGVKPECILPGAGSSHLIFLALGHWLTAKSRALILDPTYGEYAHVLERVIGCRVERLALPRGESYRLDPRRLEGPLAGGYDLVVLVNPNSPTGQHVPRAQLEQALRHVAPTTRVWVDETYVEYAGPEESLEKFAAGSTNLIVCKSMSKTYALSGARVGYLCASPHQLESLRAISPPWAVSLPAQVAAVQALQDPDYYAAKYRETHQLRRQLAEWLAPLKWDIIPSVTNFLLCLLPAEGPDAASLIARCRDRGLFLRDASTMGTQLGERAIRLAVKDAATNRRMVEIISELTPAPAA